MKSTQAEKGATGRRRRAAVSLLRQSIQDRQRWIYTDLGGIYLTDDSGAEAIESFDDATAVHFFLQWLAERRDMIARRQAIANRRASIRAVGEVGHRSRAALGGRA